MNIREYLAILSTQFPINFEKFMTWASLFESVSDFLQNCDQVSSPEEVQRIYLAQNQVDRIWNYKVKKGFQTLYPGHADYPDSFLALKNPPVHLMVQGTLAKHINGISIVGSRNPSAQVREWMATYLPYIVQEDIVIVSGAARGVDLEAHLISLRSKKPTIAFLPSGLERIYPASFSKYSDLILENGGAVVSEYDPFKTIQPFHFAQRNRMIAVLGKIVLVCEAGLRSGSYMTARLAIENARTLCVLPTFPTELRNAGGLNLLFNGAFPIRDHTDLLSLLSLHTS